MPTCRCGLIGAGIGTSFSPPLHEAEGRHQGLDLSYVLFDVDGPAQLTRAVDEAERAGFAGLNITHPFKREVIELLDDLSPQARDIGAVNTITFRDGRRQGFNTDAYGFTASFRASLPDVSTGRVVQLGAGGAGAACAYAQLGTGVGHLTVVDPDPGQRTGLAAALATQFAGDRFRVVPPEELKAAIADADGLVNASPIGMHTHPGLPLPAELLHGGLWVADIVYMPPDTALLRAARAAGLRTVGGAGMCTFQAAAAFELFTGRAPDTARMLRHLDVLLAETADQPR
ncbi:shikimate dehydrogenase [Paractinoplanes globisporus]|uniref:Shikimate dehydrogenase (NADP(+)) n=1 Tax=Paractinoplanes globisporus TaxID=113565 RepID=A0ABW6WDT0_9ACTN|nr:shikimate dehydrogenase [Actinoplanes globisporus]